MTDLRADKAEAEAIAAELRQGLDDLMNRAAYLSEFAVDAPLGLEARPPLTDSQREVAVALNTLAVLLRRRAGEAASARAPRWEGLSDAATMAENAAGYWGLPQVSFLLDDDEG